MNVRAEAVRLLLAKADQDEQAARNLAANPAMGDEIVGFHLQQAAEKCLKALLTARGIPYRRSHDLLELMDLLISHGVAVPKTVEAIQDLTPFAVDYRYEAFGASGDPPLARDQALALIAELRGWVLMHMG